MSGVEVVEATSAESMSIAARDITKALAALDGGTDHDLDHVRMYLASALIWLRP